MGVREPDNWGRTSAMTDKNAQVDLRGDVHKHDCTTIPELPLTGDAGQSRTHSRFRKYDNTVIAQYRFDIPERICRHCRALSSFNSQ